VFCGAADCGGAAGAGGLVMVVYTLLQKERQSRPTRVHLSIDEKTFLCGRAVRDYECIGDTERDVICHVNGYWYLHTYSVRHVGLYPLCLRCVTLSELEKENR
jgi:hypothetical protein